jgi:fusaric acid resistance family protein
MTQLAEMFELKRQEFNLRRGLSVLVVLLGPLIVLEAIHQQQYWIGVSFGALFVALSDPGGDYAHRVTRMAGFALIGALLTALGFGIGGWAWGLVVLAAFVITVLAGLAVKFGLHRFVMAILLNAWFVVALTLPGAYQPAHIHTHAWAQALAWLAGSALIIAYTCITWLARGRSAQPQPVAEIPGDLSPVKLTRPVILFALLRAIAVSIAVAIAFGLRLPNADWMPVATIVALKPSLQQSALAAEQRVAGTILGAAVAALFLLTVDSKSCSKRSWPSWARLRGPSAWSTTPCTAQQWPVSLSSPWTCPTRPTSPPRPAGCCSPSSASGSPSSSCSWRTCCKSAPLKRPRNHPQLAPRDVCKEASFSTHSLTRSHREGGRLT